MEQCQAVLTLVDGLIRQHWLAIKDAKDETEDHTIAISIGVKLLPDGKNNTIAKVTLAYGVRVKAAAQATIDDPNQAKLEYDLKDGDND